MRHQSDTSVPEAPQDVDVVAEGEGFPDRPSAETDKSVRENPVEHEGLGRPNVAPRVHGDVRHTRISAAWAAVAFAVVLGAALVDFIVENTHSVHINFFSASGYIPMDVVVLVAALVGAFVVLGIGVSRTTQLRLALRRRVRREARLARVRAPEGDPVSSPK